MASYFLHSSVAFSSQLSLPNVNSKNWGRSSSRCWCSAGGSSSRQHSVFSYKKFVEFALDETKCFTPLVPSSLQHSHSSTALDGETDVEMLSFEAPKVRLLRSLTIERSDEMQVLDFAVFPKPELDLPIFCANFFTAASKNIVVLFIWWMVVFERKAVSEMLLDLVEDLNPLHDVINQSYYKEKYYTNLLPLGLKYTQLLPWGGKISGESLRFFSPIVLWTRFASSQDNFNILFSAFRDYYQAWLQLMDEAAEEQDVSEIARNREAQHRYLTWRAEKDPGFQLLRRLVGETSAEDVVRKFLFNGVEELGSKTFLDYFPEYRSEDGTVSGKRSMVGKSFENRPWDANGTFLGNFG